MSRRARRGVAGAFLAGVVLGTIAVAIPVLSQPSPCCRVSHPYVSLYDRPLSHVDAVLAEGDGQAFAAIAQDPLLARPAVIGSPADYAYRAQRPLWGYLSWAASLGQPNLVGWAMAVLTALSCGFATLVMALLLVERGSSPWWAILVPLVGMPALTGFTPEVAAFALLGAGVLLWTRNRSGLAVTAFCLAALTRESMLVGVAALACWEVFRSLPGPWPWRRVAMLGPPVAVYGGWIAVLRVRLGSLPYGHADGRLGVPGAGLVSALVHYEDPLTIAARALVAVLLCAGALALARHDVGTWIAASFLAFAILLGQPVWEGGGLVRTVLPLYAFAFAALLGGVRASRSATVPQPTRGSSRAVRVVGRSAPVSISARGSPV